MVQRGRLIARVNATLVLLLLLASSLPTEFVQAHLPGDDCDIHPGMSIQAKLDASAANTHLKICAGVYAESTLINKNGITLHAYPGAILDGSLLTGTRHGIRIADGVTGLTVTGLEIRNYNDLLWTTDPSSGIVALGASSGVRISNVNIHDTAWTGVLFANGTGTNWIIENSTFSNNGLANIFSQDAKNPTIQNNTFTGAQHAIIMLKPKKGTLAHNTITGSGSTGLLIGPGFNQAVWPKNLTIHNNTITGNRTHGIWSLGLQNGTIRDNMINMTNGAAMTLGGNPQDLTLIRNAAAPVLETKDVKAARDTFKKGTPPGYALQSLDVTVLNCEWFACAIAPVRAFFDFFTSSARAQGPSPPPPPPPVECVLDTGATCQAQYIDTLLDYAVLAALNPLPGSDYAAYITRLDTCQGQPDSCLRSEFFDPGDTAPANTWTVPVENDVLLGTVQLRFIDTGIKKTWQSKGNHSTRDELNQTWTTFVLCRLYITGTPTPCTAIPRVFDFGLDITWADSEYAQHASKWRMKLPTDLTHASFDRIHGLDATIFKFESRPHDAESLAPIDALSEILPPTTDALRTHYAGSATLRCILVPSSDPLAQPDLEANDCQDPTLLKEPNAVGYYWCTSESTYPLTSHANEPLHIAQTVEVLSGGWDWSKSCTSLSDPQPTNWTSLYHQGELDALATGIGHYYSATSDEARQAAIGESSNATLQAIGRHLAIRLNDSGMPLQPNFTILNSSQLHSATNLEWYGPKANLRLDSMEVYDKTAGWTRVAVAELLSFIPVRINVTSEYRELNGDLKNDTLSFIVSDEKPFFTTDPVTVAYAGDRYGNIVAWDNDNRNFTTNFNGNATRVHSLTLVNTSTAPARTSLFDVGFPIQAEALNINACAREFWTGESNGTGQNFGNLSRLTIADDNNATCQLLPLNDINLTFLTNLLTTVEIREGPELKASYVIVGDPLQASANSTNHDTTRTLNETLERYSPTAYDQAVRTGYIRLILEIPDHDSLSRPIDKAGQASVIASIITAFQSQLGVISVEIEDVPLTPRLADAVSQAADEYGVIILTTAGTLPSATHAWKPQDKLMTIRGLAGSPRVITIGVGDASNGVAPWSRLGPTPGMTPKPDFIAPSPTSSGLGGLLNALPYVEAVALRGVHHVDLARVVLAGFAVPVQGESGAAATFWEQGFGALDPSVFLTVPSSTADLVNYTAAHTNQTDLQVIEAAGRALNLSMGQVNASTPRQILGAVLPPSAMIRAGVGATLLNVAVDTPALPASLQVDFGVVNREIQGVARFEPIDLDALLNATMDSYRVLLQEAGYTGTPLDERVSSLWALANVSAENGQNVTLNATHYYFMDLLNDDFLYGAYDRLLNVSLVDAPSSLQNVSADNVSTVRDVLEPWLPQEYYLAPERSGPAYLEIVSGSLNCTKFVPVYGVFTAMDAVLGVLNGEASTLLGTSKAPAANVYIAALPSNSKAIISNGNQEFLKSQGGQLGCLYDVRDSLSYLRNRTSELRDLKALPWGALNATEQWTGSWNQTALGGAVNASLTAMGLVPQEAALQNSTIVLDKTIELLDRAKQLVDDKVTRLAIPITRTDGTSGVTSLLTEPSRTSASPAGLYVGIATMTSHDVKLRNPFTGQEVLRRNVTIPLPSFLWNNPTLVVDAAYRDTSPLAFNEVLLRNQDPSIFNNIVLNANVTVNQSKIPLIVNQSDLAQQELDAITGRIELIGNVSAAVNESTSTLFSNFAQTFRNQLELFQRGLEARAYDVSLQANSSNVQATGNLTNVTNPLLTTLLASMVSRLNYQGGLTDENGLATMPNLFPGNYVLYMPYGYAIANELNTTYPVVGPGGGALEAPMGDLDWDVNRLVRDFQAGLIPHPTALDPRETASVPVDDDPGAIREYDSESMRGIFPMPRQWYLLNDGYVQAIRSRELAANTTYAAENGNYSVHVNTSTPGAIIAAHVNGSIHSELRFIGSPVVNGTLQFKTNITRDYNASTNDRLPLKFRAFWWLDREIPVNRSGIEQYWTYWVDPADLTLVSRPDGVELPPAPAQVPPWVPDYIDWTLDNGFNQDAGNLGLPVTLGFPRQSLENATMVDYWSQFVITDTPGPWVNDTLTNGAIINITPPNGTINYTLENGSLANVSYYTVRLIGLELITGNASGFYIDDLSLIDYNDALPPVPFTGEILWDRSFEDPWQCFGLYSRCDYFPAFEVYGDWFGPFHQFGLVIDAPDLIGVACKLVQKFGSDTGTSLRYPGCGSPLLPEDASEEAGALRSLAACVIGEPHTGLDEDTEMACNQFRNAAGNASAHCSTGNASACIENESYRRFTSAARNLSNALALTLVGQELVVPWIHSANRTLREKPESVGFTVGGLLDGAKRQNPGANETQLEDNIRTALRDLNSTLLTSVLTLAKPANSTRQDVTEPQAILHRFTDRVSGLDWFHFDTSAQELQSTPDNAIDRVTDAVKDIKNGADNDTIADYLFHLDLLTTDQITAAFNAGLNLSLQQRAASILTGKRFNGSVTPDGIMVPGQDMSAVLSAPQVCTGLNAATMLPTTFFSCQEIRRTIDDTSLVMPGGVERVQFDNALLEAVKKHPNFTNNATIIQKILTEAVASSRVASDQDWKRTTDAILVSAKDQAPVLGLMAYSVPLPANEYVQYRLDAEILAQNTGALIVSTANPLITEALMLGLQNLSVANISGPLAITQVDPHNATVLNNTGANDYPRIYQIAPDTTAPGTSYNYTIRIEPGPNNLTNVTLFEKLPNSLALLSASEQPAANTSNGPSWTLDTLQANTNKTIEIQVRLNSTAQNNSNVTTNATLNATLPDNSNISHSDKHTVVAITDAPGTEKPTYTVTKNAPDNVYPGMRYNQTITIQTTDEPLIDLTILEPPNTWLQIMGANPMPDQQDQNGTLWKVAFQAPNTTLTIQIDTATNDTVANETLITTTTKATANVSRGKLRVDPRYSYNYAASVLNIFQTAAESGGVGKETLLRVDAIGLPLGLEQIAAVQTENLVENECVVCEFGLATLKPDGFYNYTKTHELKTRNATMNPLGPDTLFIIIIYFPSVAGVEADSLQQKLLIRNFSIQATTFIGLDARDSRTTNEFNTTIPIRYRSNIEDWKMYYSVPDQEPVWSPTNPTASTNASLYANFTMTQDGVTRYYNATNKQMSRGLWEPTYTSWCADTVAPGYPTRSFYTQSRLVPGPSDRTNDKTNGLYWASVNCAVTS
ncbi:MAG: right-handed parallel beta-helix repeat-containing protein [Euryarchaeota archaeon]|nr:right-handed parallel beta-helix repeat-containing protein [Euryarchaeota archaeon]